MQISRLKLENEFGAIILSEILEHVEKPDIILKSLKNQLRADGRIFVNVPIWSPAPDHILFRNEDDAIELINESGYQIELFNVSHEWLYCRQAKKYRLRLVSQQYAKRLINIDVMQRIPK